MGRRGGSVNSNVSVILLTQKVKRELAVDAIDNRNFSTNKNLLYSTGNSTQYSVMAYMGIESNRRIYMYIYVYV